MSWKSPAVGAPLVNGACARQSVYVCAEPDEASSWAGISERVSVGASSNEAGLDCAGAGSLTGNVSVESTAPP